MKRICRSFLASLVFFTQAVFAYSIETNFWKERQSAAIPNLPLMTQRTVRPLEPLSARVENSEDLSSFLKKLPADLATFSASPVQPSLRKGTVIHIQDVHTNLDAQRKIGALVKLLVDKANVSVIGLEGAHGVLDFKSYANLEEKTRAKTADRLLENLEIGGPVHFALSEPRSRATFVGVDDPKLFKQNWATVRGVVSSVKTLRQILNERNERFTQEKTRSFNPTLKSFDDSVQAYRENKLGLGDYVEILFANGGGAGVNERLFRSAHAIEKNLSMPMLQRKQQEFVQGVTKKMNADSRDVLSALVNSFRSGQTTQREFYGRLFALAPNEVPKELRAYVGYLEMSSTLNAETLMREIRSSEQTIYGRLARSAREKSLVDKSESLFQAQKLVNFCMTPQEWQWYQTSTHSNEIGFFKTAFDAFYKLAEKRNQAIADNLVAAMDSGHQRVAVLVTGGFHSNGILAALQKKDIEVLTLTPQLQILDSAVTSESLTSVARNNESLAALFSQGNTFLTQPVWTPSLAQRSVTLWAVYAKLAGLKNIVPSANKVLAPFSSIIGQVWVVSKNVFYFVLNKTGVHLKHGRVDVDRPGDLADMPIARSPLFDKRLAFKFLLVIFVALLVAGPLFAQSTSAGGGDMMSAVGSFLLEQFRPKLFLQPWHIINSLAGILAGIYLAWVYDRTHTRGDYETEVPQTLREMLPLLVLMYVGLQLAGLLGLTVAAILAAARLRTIIRSLRDWITLIGAINLSFVFGSIPGVTGWTLSLYLMLIITATKTINAIHHRYGRKRAYDGSLSLSFKETVDPKDYQKHKEALEQLLKKFVIKSDLTHFTSGSTSKEGEEGFSFKLVDPTRRDPVLGGIEGLSRLLNALFGDVFNFNIQNYRDSAGVVFSAGSWLPPLVGGSLLLFAGDAFAGDGSSASFTFGINDVTNFFELFADPNNSISMLPPLIGLAIFWILLWFAFAPVALSKSDDEFRVRIESKKMTDEDKERIMKGPQSVSAGIAFKHSVMANIIKIVGVLCVATLLVAHLVFDMPNDDSTGVEGVVDVVEKKVQMPLEKGGRVQFLHAVADHVKKGGILGYAYPSDIDNLRVQVEKIRAAFDSQVKQARVEEQRNLTTVEQARMNYSQNRFALGGLQATVAANDVLLGHARGEYEVLRRLAASGAATQMQVNFALREVNRLADLIANNKTEMADTEKRLAEAKLAFAPRADGKPSEHVARSVQVYEEFVAAKQREMESTINDLVHQYTPRPLISQVNGDLQQVMTVNTEIFKYGDDIAVVRNQTPTKRITAYILSGYTLLKKDQLVKVRLKSTRTRSAIGKIVYVSESPVKMPTGVFERTISARNSASSRTPIPPGAPKKAYKVQVQLEDGKTFPPDEDILMTPYNSRLKNILNWLGASTDDTKEIAGKIGVPAKQLKPVGTLDGQSVYVVNSGRTNFGDKAIASTGLRQISAVTVLSDGRILVGDDQAERVQALRVANAEKGEYEFVEAIDIKGLADKETMKDGVLDLEGMATVPEGVIDDAVRKDWVAKVFERQRMLYFVNAPKGERLPQLNSAIRIRLPKEKLFDQIEGIAFHPTAKTLFMVNTKGKELEGKSTLFETKVDVKKGKIDRVGVPIYLPDLGVGAVRDIALYTPPSGKSPVLLLLENAVIPKIRIFDIAKRRLLEEYISLSEFAGKGQPEALGVLPNNLLFVGFETKHFEKVSGVVNHVTLRIGELDALLKEKEDEKEQGKDDKGAWLNGLRDQVARRNAVASLLSREKESQRIKDHRDRSTQRASRYYPAGLYGFWLPFAQRFPVAAPFIFGVVESLPPLAIILFSQDPFAGALWWALANAAVKAVFGFIVYVDGAPVRQSVLSNPSNFAASNVVSWTSFIGVFGWLFHPLVNLFLFWRSGSLSRTLSHLEDGKLLIMTVNDSSSRGDIERISRLQAAAAKDKPIAKLLGNVLVVYLGSSDRIPTDVTDVSTGLAVVKGSDIEKDRYGYQGYNLNAILTLASADLNGRALKPGIASRVTELADPKNPQGAFVTLSSDYLFCSTSQLEKLRYTLGNILGADFLYQGNTLADMFKQFATAMISA